MRGTMLPRLLLAAAAAATAVFLVSCTVDAGGCAMCGREECRNLAFTVRMEDGGVVETCCPRCGLRYIAEEHPKVASLEVRDFATAKSIDARAAFYVEGSDVHPCAAGHDGPPKDERGCCLKPVFDRCLPSALAFADRETAETFARENGGFVTAFESLSAARR